MAQKKRFNTRLIFYSTKEMQRKLFTLSDESGIPVSELVRRSIETYLADRFKII